MLINKAQLGVIKKTSSAALWDEEHSQGSFFGKLPASPKRGKKWGDGSGASGTEERKNWIPREFLDKQFKRMVSFSYSERALTEDRSLHCCLRCVLLSGTSGRTREHRRCERQIWTRHVRISQLKQLSVDFSRPRVMTVHTIIHVSPHQKHRQYCTFF